MATDVVLRRQTRWVELATSGYRRIYRQRVAKPDVVNEVDVNRFVAEFAMQMNDRVVELSSFIRGALEDEIPELRGDARTIELLGASVEGNVDTLLHALRHDIAVDRVEAPTAALEYARRLAQHGVPVNALVRAYRLGQRQLNDLVFQALHEADISPATRLAALETITTTLFEYIDWISQQVVAVYEEERERWLENQSSIRALQVREVVAGKAKVDVDATSDSIRYPLRWHHLAVVMWYSDEGASGDELDRLQRFLRELGQATDVGSNPLFAAADQTTGWGWLPYRSAPADAVESVRQFARQARRSAERGNWHGCLRSRRISPVVSRSAGGQGRRGRRRRQRGDCDRGVGPRFGGGRAARRRHRRGQGLGDRRAW